MNSKKLNKLEACMKLRYINNCSCTEAEDGHSTEAKNGHSRSRSRSILCRKHRRELGREAVHICVHVRRFVFVFAFAFVFVFAFTFVFVFVHVYN